MGKTNNKLNELDKQIQANRDLNDPNSHKRKHMAYWNMPLPSVKERITDSMKARDEKIKFASKIGIKKKH